MQPCSKTEVATPYGNVVLGDRVRLRPAGNGDIFDLALNGKIAVVTGIEQDMEDHSYVVVVLEDDPGRDLGYTRKPGHCFFFRPEEVEPIDSGKQELP